LLRIVKEEDDSCDIMWTNPHFTVWSGRWFTQWHCSSCHYLVFRITL